MGRMQTVAVRAGRRVCLPLVQFSLVMALAACPGPQPSSLTCREGTFESDGGCYGLPVQPTAPASITRARLTLLKLKYDVNKPLFLNNALPIRFGITATSENPAKPVTTPVVVVFSFVEAAPADPAAPKSCDSNGIELKLVGDGLEHQFDADIYPTTDCAAWVGTSGATANLKVDFDRGLRESDAGTRIDYPPVVFSSASESSPDNQACRKTSSATAPTPGRGCVYALGLKPTPVSGDGGALVDVQIERLQPESSVAVLWPTGEDPSVPDGGAESDPPSLVVNAVFVMEGRDPYKNQVDVSKLPPELKAAIPTIEQDLRFGLSDEGLAALDNLPGDIVIRYDLAPTNKIRPDAWLPLMIDDPSNPNPDGHVATVRLNELEPGTENSFVHALFIEGATRTEVSATGAWAREDDYTVRGCLFSEFPEGGNTGDEDADEAAVGGEAGLGDCKTFKVRLVRAPSPTGSASAQSFDHVWERTVGDPDRVALIGRLGTTNTLDLSGARTDTEGKVEIRGKIGSDFTVQLFRAYAKGGALTSQAQSYVDLGVEAFGVNLFGYQNTSNEQTYATPFTVAKSFQFPGLSFGFGPVSVGITAGVGGNLGVTPSMAISAKDGAEASIPELAMATSNGMIQTTTTPNVGLTGNVTGGIDVWVAKAAAVATVQIIDIGFPLTATVRWGVTERDMETMAVKKLSILGDLKWDMTITWLNLSVDVVGEIRLVFFKVSKTFNVFKYTTAPDTISLLNRKLEPVVLE
jgi:hypothetical protein